MKKGVVSQYEAPLVIHWLPLVCPLDGGGRCPRHLAD